MGEKRNWSEDGTPKALGAGRYGAIVPEVFQAMDRAADERPADWYVAGDSYPPERNRRIEDVLSHRPDGSSIPKTERGPSIEGMA